jgi:hypothetical protein
LSVPPNTTSESVVVMIAPAPINTGLLKVIAPLAVLVTLPANVMLLPAVAV